jgi:hypothetical protein
VWVGWGVVAKKCTPLRKLEVGKDEGIRDQGQSEGRLWGLGLGRWWWVGGEGLTNMVLTNLQQK